MEKVISIFVFCILVVSCASRPLISNMGVVSGEYRYLGSGVAKVAQTGKEVHIYLTWTPQGLGPHYEVKGKLIGNTIEGVWYSYLAKTGWFYFNGEVSPSRKIIDFSKSEDPIKSNVNKVVLVKN